MTVYGTGVTCKAWQEIGEDVIAGLPITLYEFTG